MQFVHQLLIDNRTYTVVYGLPYEIDSMVLFASEGGYYATEYLHVNYAVGHTNC